MDSIPLLKKILGVVIVAILVLIAVFLFGIDWPKQKTQSEISARDYSPELSQLEAKSFLVYDVYAKEIIFSKNEREKLPLASITKLMTGFVVLDVLPETTEVRITRDDIALGSGTGILLTVGIVYRLYEELAKAQLLELSQA